MLRRIILAAFLVVVVLLLARYAIHGDLGFGSEERLLAASRVLPVKTVRVREEDHYTLRRFYTGTIRSARVSDLGFEGRGRVVAVHVEAGEEVSKGQALAQLDIRRLKAQRKELLARRVQESAQLDELRAGPREEEIRQARSRIRDVEEQLALTGKKRDRAMRLLEEQVVSQDAFDDAASNEKQLTARLEAAREQLAELLAGTRPERIRAQEGALEQLDALLDVVDVDIENSTLRAPFDGVVGERRLDEGSVVSPAEVVVRVLEDAAPEAWVGIPILMAETIVPGQVYSLEIGGRQISATAVGVLPEIDAVTRMVTAVFALNSTAGPVYPGQVVRLALEKKIDEQGMWIPTRALTRGVRGLWNCYAVARATGTTPGQDFQLEHRQVEVLHIEGERLYVRGTLRDGDLIVSEGTHRLAAGQFVTPIDS